MITSNGHTVTLEVPTTTSTAIEPAASSSVSKGTIAGATVGGVAGLLLTGAATFYYMKRRRASTVVKLDRHTKHDIPGEQPQQRHGRSELDNANVSEVEGQKQQHAELGGIGHEQHTELDAGRDVAELDV